jgi:hypothetical protein
MDHPSTAIRPEQWRQTALVAACVAALELFVLALMIVFLIVRPLMADDGAPAAQKSKAAAERSSSAPAGQKKAKPAQPTLKRTQTSVIVLNGNGVSGMASEKADLVRTKGYLIAGTANAPRTDFARSVVMYRPGYEPEARRFARDFRIRRVSPLDGMRPAQLQGAHVALIVGNA